MLQSPLHQAHLNAKARMVPFAGYDMPVQYEGVISECLAVRTHAGMFDVSHMARLRFRGERTQEFLQWVTSADVARLADMTGQYSLLPNENGGVVDDIIVYRLQQDQFAMVVNAANHAKDVAWLKAQNTFGVEMVDVTTETCMIAVQGPHATSLLAEHSDQEEALLNAPMFGVVNAHIGDVATMCCRSGYTGEDGCELIAQKEDAMALWDTLLKMGVVPCGLGSRDALRVEAGLPLYGHELGDDFSPIEAGLGWVIGKEKVFIGSSHIRQTQLEGAKRKLVGIQLEGKRLMQIGAKVYVDGLAVGEVSSAVYSPLKECGIAFAFVDPTVSLNTACEVEVRDQRLPAKIVNKRFFRREA